MESFDPNLDLEDPNYSKVIKDETDYGVKMTDELEKAVQGVMDLDYNQFSSEEGAEVIQTALQEAEEAPEASVYDDVIRQTRIRNRFSGYFEEVESLDLDEMPDYSLSKEDYRE